MQLKELFVKVTNGKKKLCFSSNLWLVQTSLVETPRKSGKFLVVLLCGISVQESSIQTQFFQINFLLHL